MTSTANRTEGSASEFGSGVWRSADPFRILGTVVDSRYVVERVVGSGGSAIVYRARHLRFDSPVALKFLHLPLRQPRGREQEFSQRLLAEGKILFELGSLHTSFVRVFEMGTLTTVDGIVAPYLTLEWLEGMTLKDYGQHWRQSGQRLTLLEALALFGHIAKGLSVAHQHGIAHRDLKPANVFITLRDGEAIPRLLDFGIAKTMNRGELGSDAFDDEASVQTPFTPAYGAPEQWQGTLGATGTWTDVHALALVLGEFLANAPPLLGEDSASLRAACLDVARRPTPRTLGVDVTDDVEAVFAKALAVNPRDRYREAGAFWTALCGAARFAEAEKLPLCSLPPLGALIAPRAGLAHEMTAMTLETAAKRGS